MFKGTGTPKLVNCMHACMYSYIISLYVCKQSGVDPGFPEGGSESGVYIGGRANPSVVSLK